MRDSTRANLIIFWSGDEAEGRMTSLDTVDPERLYPNCKWTTRYNVRSLSLTLAGNGGIAAPEKILSMNLQF